MIDPYDILNVQQDASDQEIKQSYLNMVKKYTPDSHPEEFQQLRTAYEKISTLYNRLSFDLLEAPLPNKDDIYHLLTKNDKNPVLEGSDFMKLLSLAITQCGDNDGNQ